MKKLESRRWVRDNLVKSYNISHLSASEAKVSSVSSFSCGEFSIKPKAINHEKHQIIDEIGSKAEVSDYAILMGADFYEDNGKRYGYYWTNTPVESEYFLNIGEGVEEINYYDVYECKTDYTFYGYNIGNQVDHLKDPCIIEIKDENGYTLCLNQDGELWTLLSEEKFFGEATIGACMSGPKINKTIISFVKDEYLGFTYDYLEKLYKEVRRNEFYTDVDDFKYLYVGGSDSLNIRHASDKSVGIRPVFNTYNYSSINSLCDRDIKYSLFCDFPQTVVSKEEQKKLDKLLKKGAIKTTDRFFPTSNDGVICEYEYDNKRYVRVSANFNNCERTLLSNGCAYKNGDKVWVRVEPVELVVQKDNYCSLVNKILFAGVSYKDSLIVNPFTSLRSSDFIHYLLMNVSDYLFTNEKSLDDRIICGTDWMKQYHYTKDMYALFDIPFEESEEEAACRYKSEYNKLVEYCKKVNKNIKFDKFDLNSNGLNRIFYSYRPSCDFLNSFDNPITQTLAALGPRNIWNNNFYNEYLRAYGLWALLTLQEENIVKISEQLYDEKIEKALKLK